MSSLLFILYLDKLNTFTINIWPTSEQYQTWKIKVKGILLVVVFYYFILLLHNISKTVKGVGDVFKTKQKESVSFSNITTYIRQTIF